MLRYNDSRSLALKLAAGQPHHHHRAHPNPPLVTHDDAKLMIAARLVSSGQLSSLNRTL
jgi:hypothetical protein